MSLANISLWPLLRPVAEALARANSQGSSTIRILAYANVDTLASDDGSNIVVKFTRPELSNGLVSLRKDATYYDEDGHVVFISGYADDEGNLVEIELGRIDLQPIGQLPNVEELSFQEPVPGFYRTSK